MAERKQNRFESGGRQEHESGGGVMEAVRESAEGMASNVASAAGQTWDVASQGARQAASAVTETVGGAWSDLRSCMARYPFAVFFTGIGVGALLALALERRYMHAGHR